MRLKSNKFKITAAETIRITLAPQSLLIYLELTNQSVHKIIFKQQASIPHVTSDCLKYCNEGTLIKNIVLTLSIKNVPDPQIIIEVDGQTNKTITRKEIYNLRQ